MQRQEVDRAVYLSLLKQGAQCRSQVTTSTGIELSRVSSSFDRLSSRKLISQVRGQGNRKPIFRSYRAELP